MPVIQAGIGAAHLQAVLAEHRGDQLARLVELLRVQQFDTLGDARLRWRCHICLLAESSMKRPRPGHPFVEPAQAPLTLGPYGSSTMQPEVRRASRSRCAAPACSSG
ncbi:hypothetical protein D3C78_1498210 [compost metagenome]